MAVKKNKNNSKIVGVWNNEIEQRDKAAIKKKYWVRLTRACNNHCIFCLDKEAQNSGVLTLENIFAELKKGRKGDFKQVILSGGEATLHPEFLMIVKEAKKMGYERVQVITNGRMFAYNDFLRRAVINGVNEITFSIHGHNARLHDRQTGVKGSFEQVIQGLKNSLKIPGLLISIDIVINKINYRWLKDILDYFINLGVREFDLLQIIPFGRAWDNRNVLFYDIKKALPFLRQALKLAENSDLAIWTNRFPAQYLEGFEFLIQHPSKLSDEIRGRKEMFDNFLNKGRKMSCFGKRCKYCFLSNFCADLIELKEKGILFAKQGPFCLNFNLGGQQKIYKKKIINIYDFLDFYIKSRYFIKGGQCQKCALSEKCGGAPCDFIRKSGFKKLKAILKK